MPGIVNDFSRLQTVFNTIFSQEEHQSVKEIRSRSHHTFRQAESGSELFGNTKGRNELFSQIHVPVKGQQL